MKCAHCESVNTRVLSTRGQGDTVVRRRHECQACGKRYSTKETYEVADTGARRDRTQRGIERRARSMDIRAQVVRLLDKGWMNIDIAPVVGVSKQRVSKIRVEVDAERRRETERKYAEAARLRDPRNWKQPERMSA